MSKTVKRIGKFILDRSVVPILSYTIAQAQPGSGATLCNSARKKAIDSSLEYVEEKMSCALMFSKRVQLWDYALSKICLTGTCAEFGVWKGESINYFATK